MEVGYSGMGWSNGGTVSQSSEGVFHEAPKFVTITSAWGELFAVSKLTRYSPWNHGWKFLIRLIRTIVERWIRIKLCGLQLSAQLKYGESILKAGCDFGFGFCPFLSTFVHMCKQQKPPKLEALVLKILKLALYARRDSNPQPCAPEANVSHFVNICFYIF